MKTIEALSTERALKLALEALESCGWNDGYAGENQYFHDDLVDKAITTLREALASEAIEQPAQCSPAEDGVCEALDCSNHKPAQQQYEALEDCKSHYQSWRDALCFAKNKAENEADQSYWTHEIKAFDRTFQALAEQPAHHTEQHLEMVAEQPAQQCKWPTCQNEEYQQALAQEVERELVGEQPAPATELREQEPAIWAISYDGKTPYAIWFDGDGVLLDLEVKRQGGTTCKLPLYTSPPYEATPLAQRQARSADTWVGLSPTDRGKCLSAGDAHGWIGVMEATETRLKELNT